MNLNQQIDAYAICQYCIKYKTLRNPLWFMILSKLYSIILIISGYFLLGTEGILSG